MSIPAYLEIEEVREMDMTTPGLMLDLESIRIPVETVEEAKQLLPQFAQEFIDRGIPYKASYHFHTHGVLVKHNMSCIVLPLLGV